MDEERSLFDRLDSIETTSETTKKMVAEILDILQTQKSDPSTKPQPQQQPTDREILQRFLRNSRKSWRWFGTKAQFIKAKSLAILSWSIFLAVGLITTVVSSACFQIYSTFTFFENIWMIFGIINLVNACKTQLVYEVNALAASSPLRYDTDKVGMKLPRKEKLRYRIFRWFAIISVACNILCIWIGLGKSLQVAATIMEVLFFGAIVFAFFMNSNLFRDYCIAWVEGYNLTTGKPVVLVLPPGAKQLMSEEEFKQKLPFFYE